MQVKTTKWLILLLLLVFCRCTGNSAGDVPVEPEPEDRVIAVAGFPKVSDKYVYPIVPGMEEWREANKVANGVIEFQQLPDDILKSISTQGLIDALIHAPSFSNSNIYSVYSQFQHFKYKIYPLFNSADELFQREDAGDALVAYYKLSCINCVETWTDIESWMIDCCYSFFELLIGRRFVGLELLFAIPEILDKMDHVKKQEAVAAILANYEQYKYWNAIIPMIHIMLADEYEPMVTYVQAQDETFSHYILDGWGPLNHENVIIFYAKNYINE